MHCLDSSSDFQLFQSPFSSLLRSFWAQTITIGIIVTPMFHSYFFKILSPVFVYLFIFFDVHFVVRPTIRIIGQVDRMFANGPGDLDSIPGRVIPKTLRWYLIPPCLTLSNIKCVSMVKWSNPGKGVTPSPTSRCSSYWKGSLLVALNYGRQLFTTCSPSGRQNPL